MMKSKQVALTAEEIERRVSDSYEVPNRVLEVMPAPLVTVRTSTYQHAPYIEQCIEGVLMQETSFPFEYIIGEDFSTDGTREIVFDYAKKYPDKIRVITADYNVGGKANGRRCGNASRGKYMAQCEGDDFWTDPLKLQKQIDLLEKSPEYSGCFHETQVLFEDGRLGKIYGKDAPLILTAEDTIAALSPFHSSSFVYQRKCFKQTKWKREISSGDMALFSIVASFGHLAKIPSIMSVYRKHKGGLTERSDFKEHFHEDRIKLIKCLDEFHCFKYHEKAKQIIRFHEKMIQEKQIASGAEIVSRDNFTNPVITPGCCDLYVARKGILDSLRQHAFQLTGTLLDVGCGQMPYKEFLLKQNGNIRKYMGLDIANGKRCDVEGPDLTWDGNTIPLDDNSVDCAMASEVLEHCPEPLRVIQEIQRVLKAGGVFFLTSPFFWPLHDTPFDYYRYTPFSLDRMLAEGGFEDIDVRSLGGWNASLAQMIGLWLKRAPMDNQTRNHMAQQLWPLYTQLIKTDVPVNDPKAGNNMSIGWAGLAFKPAESTVAEDVFERGDTRVCLVRSHAHNYSETFIQDHVDHLSENLDVVYGHPYPHMGLDGQPVFSAERLKGLHQTSDGNQKERIYDEALAEYFQRRGFSVVLAESGLMGSFIYRACAIAGVPFVVHFHGADAFVNALIDQLRPHFDRFFHSASALVVVSRAMRDQLLRLGAPEDKVILGPYGVSIAQTALSDPKNATPIFLAVGRFVEKKSPHLTVKAFEKVWKEVPEARLIMVGDGPLLSHCKKLVEALGLDDAVTFTGVFSRRAVSRLMQTSRCFVQHSVIASNGDSEGLPLAILEAGAHGLPVVATRHAGIPDAVIEGEHGFLVDEQDVDGMAAAMHRMARDPDLAGTMGKAYRQRIEARFTRAHAIQRLQGILAKAAEEGFKGNNKEGELGKGTHIKDNEQSAPFFQDGSNALEATEGQGNGGLRERRLRERIGLDRNDGHGYLELAEHFVQKEDFEQAYICFKEAERVGGLPDQVVPIIQQMEQNPHLDTPVVLAYRERIGLNGSGKADNPRRILVFTNLLPPQEMGGYGRTVWELCDGLLKRGHTVRILTADMPRYAKTPEPGWERVEKHVERSLHLYGDWDQGVARVLDDTEQIATVIRHNHHAIQREVDRFAPDACMAGNLDFVGAGFIDSILEKGVPVVHRLGNARPGYPAENTPKSPLYCLAGASHWINQQLQQAGYLAGNFDVLPPGSPLHAYYRAFLPRFDRLRICFAGLVMAYKGPHVLIQALSLLKKAGVDFTCEIAGDPKDPKFGDYLRQMIAKEDLDKAVRLIGFQSRKGLAALYARSNTMVFPSVFEEPFGKSQIEAQAAGLAVISSGTGGCADIIENGTNGLIFKNQDAQDLARQLFRLDNDKDLWKRLARQGQRDAFRYTTHQSVEKLESIVEKLLMDDK